MSWHVKAPVEGSRHLDIVDDEGRTIAHVHRRTGMEPGEYKRNAELLAGACTPDWELINAAMETRFECEAVHVENDRLRAALMACLVELTYVHECEVWINRGEERYAAIEVGREALAAPRAAKVSP